MLLKLYRIGNSDVKLMGDSNSKVEQIRLLSFVNPVSLVRERKKWKVLKAEMQNGGVDLRLRPMIVKPVYSWYLIIIGLLFCLPIIIIETKNSRSNVIHSRSYFASILSLISAKITDCQHIFDPRGPLPEEFVLNGVIRKGSITYKFWKRIEKHLFENSDAVIAVAPFFKNLFIREGAKKVVFVPNRGDTDEFFTASQFERNQKKVDSESNILLFVGEKIDSYWYPPERIAQHFKYLKTCIPDLKLQVLTSQNHEFIIQRFKHSGLSTADYSVDASAPTEISSRIARADLALLLGLKPAADWSVWPVKFAEYLGAGIPLVVEREVGEDISREVQKWEIGCVVDRKTPDSYGMAADIIADHSTYSDNCIRYAQKRMDIKQTAQQFLRLYRQVLNS